jgi:hypothetical protein
VKGSSDIAKLVCKAVATLTITTANWKHYSHWHRDGAHARRSDTPGRGRRPPDAGGWAQQRAAGSHRHSSLTVTIWNPHVAPYAPIVTAATLSAIDLVTGKVSLREGFLVAGRLTAEIRAAWSDGTILKFAGPLVVDPSPTG